MIILNVFIFLLPHILFLIFGLCTRQRRTTSYPTAPPQTCAEPRRGIPACIPLSGTTPGVDSLRSPLRVPIASGSTLSTFRSPVASVHGAGGSCSCSITLQLHPYFCRVWYGFPRSTRPSFGDRRFAEPRYRSVLRPPPEVSYGGQVASTRLRHSSFAQAGCEG